MAHKKDELDINEIIKRKILVEFDRRPLEKSSLFGFVLACNKNFTLIHEFNPDSFVLDGYCAFRNDSVKGYQIYNDDNYFLCEVLSLKKIKPISLPSVLINSWREILETASKKFPLVMIEREKIDNKSCNIGTIEKFKKTSFVLKEIDTCAEWDDSFSYKYQDLTKVGMGGLYENTLAFVVKNRHKLASKKSKQKRDA